MPKPDFANGLGRLSRASGQERPKPPEALVAEASPPPASRGPRDGLVQIAGHYDPAVRKQLALIGVEQNRDQRDLLAEALNDLFVKYGKSEVASVYGEGSKSKPRGK